MSLHDENPELAGYEPSDGRPLRGRKTRLLMQVVVVLGLIALIVPGIITTVSVAARTADASCAIWVAYSEPSALDSEARFEIIGDHGFGWQCYTSGAFGGDRFIASLGVIPGTPRLPSTVPLDS
jgi:hypothetical protein